MIEPTPKDSPRGRRTRVLVVDDNPDLVESLVAVVSMLGHDGRGVHSGAEALAHLADTLCDLVLMDVSMPGLTGFETARLVRREPWGCSLFLVAMTGWGRDEDRRQAMEAGFDWMVEKPIDVEGIRTLLAGFHTPEGPPDERPE
jgi:CheY-like chemotaxis protein